MKKLIIILLLAVTVVVLGGAQLTVRKYRDQAFRSDSIAAANDTARMLALDALNDSTNAWQLRIIQTQLQMDSVEQELRQRPVVRVHAGIRVDTLTIVDTVEAPVEETDSVKQYEFGGSDGPFDFWGGARIYAGGPAHFSVNVAPNRPIPVEARITCGAGPGVRSASLLLTAEDPFDVIPESVVQDPAICNPSVPIFEFTTGKGIWAAGGLGIGVILSHLFDDGFRKAKY